MTYKPPATQFYDLTDQELEVAYQEAIRETDNVIYGVFG